MIPRTLLFATLALVLTTACEVGVEQGSGDKALDSAPADAQTGDTGAEPGAPASEYAFTLPDTEGQQHALDAYLADGKTVVLEWFNPDCPFVQRYHAAAAMKGYAASLGDDVVWLAVNSGAPGKQGSGVERNRRAREEWGIPYPVLLDESGEVGRMFGAKTTPHMFVITPDDGIIYQGGIDESDGRGDPAAMSLVQKAVAQHAAGEPVTIPTAKEFGCTVKYGE